MKKTHLKTILIILAVICLPVSAYLWYHAITPQDRYFIHLEENDIESIFLYNGRTGKSEIELTGSERQEVVGQLLEVTLKDGWRTEWLNGRGKMYHIILADGREFDFGVLAYLEQESDGNFHSNPHYVIDGIRMYNVPKKEVELSEQIKKLYFELMGRFYPVDEND